MEWFYPDYNNNFIGHGFLGVAFFSAYPDLLLGMPTNLSMGSKTLCVFSGKISYPLYMTHYAAIFGRYYVNNEPGTCELSIIIVTGTILLVSFAYLVMVLFDIPIRRYLTTKRQQEFKP